MPRGGFALTKWYLDCLSRDGHLVILYWTALEWRRLRLSWHSVAVCAPGTRPVTRSSVVPSAAPEHTGTSTQWISTRLGIRAELAGGVSPIQTQQLASGVAWSCVTPGAIATIQLGDDVHRGTGYAERIELRVRPWTLGIKQLRWGRWISHDGRRAVVWIEWNGAAAQRWVFVDHNPSGIAVLTDNLVTADNASLELGAPTVVVDRALNSTVNRIPALRAVAPRWLSGGHELRRTRTGTLREGTRSTQGTAVDEVVEFG